MTLKPSDIDILLLVKIGRIRKVMPVSLPPCYLDAPTSQVRLFYTLLPFAQFFYCQLAPSFTHNVFSGVPLARWILLSLMVKMPSNYESED